MDGVMRECIPSELDLFGPIGLQNTILDQTEVEFSNISSLEGASVIEFTIVNKAIDTYVDLASTTLMMGIQMLKEDGSKYKETKAQGSTPAKDERASQPSMINNMLSSIVKSVQISMNGVVVSTTQLYAYKHYFDTVLNFGNDAGATQLTMGGFFKDPGTSLDDATDTNTGAKSRRTVLLDSGIVNLYGKLNCDVFNTPKLLLNGVDLKITIILNEPDFYMLETGTSKLVINKSSILMRFCKINQSMILHHEKLLNSQKALYPYAKSNIRSFVIPTGIQTISIDNIINGVLPDSLVFGFVTNEAFNGTKSKSPYNFQIHGMQSFGVYVNGALISGHPIELDKYHYHKYIKAYRSLFQNTQSLYKDTSSMISYTDFRDGYFILPINLTPTLELTGGQCAHPLKQGTLKVELKFYDATKSPINMIVYSETNGMFSIDKNRNVALEY